LLLTGVTALYIYLFVSTLNALNTKSYVFKKSELYKLDSIKMLSKLYKINNGKAGSSYKFSDETYKTFVFNGNADVSAELVEKLESSEAVMNIYTDNEGYENYYKKDDGNIIEVFELEIGNRNYINIADINIEKGKRKYQFLFIMSILFLFFLIIHFYRITRLVPLK